MFPIGALIGNIYLLIYMRADVITHKNTSKLFLLILLIVYFITNVVNYVCLTYKQKEVESLNKSECLQIDEYINKYENESKIKIKYVSVYYDSNPTYYYKTIKNKSALCIRPLSVEWADDGSINYYTSRNLIEISSNKKIYNTYFKDKDWNKLSEEQFIFIDDIMYYCVY